MIDLNHNQLPDPVADYEDRLADYMVRMDSRLEELEETRLPYFTGEMDKRENRWDRIISGCDLNDTI